MHIPKKGLRALGIAESYAGREHSTLAGVVMRKDLRIDGFCSGRVTVGGMDATDTILEMIRDLDRLDINVVLLSGCVIAWFNVTDPERIAAESGIPVICVTYEESDGLLEDLRHHFPGDEERVQAYLRLGERVPVDLDDHRTIYLRAAGIGYPDAARFCRDFTLEGKIPEPLRVARLCARQVFSLHGAVYKWQTTLPEGKYSYPSRKNRTEPVYIKKELKGKMPTDDKNARWVCLECHYIYDTAKGDPKNGIPARTPWENVPDTWRCPECKILKAKKGVFRRLED